MRRQLKALPRRRTAWLLVGALFLALAPPAAAKSAEGGTGGAAKGSWSSNPPSGWSAGPVTLGTGFTRPGASARVREVQGSLNELGYDAGKVDGLFGPITDGAVRRFQRQNGLAIDGIVGAGTLRSLHIATRRATLAAEIDRAARGLKQVARQLRDRLSAVDQSPGPSLSELLLPIAALLGAIFSVGLALRTVRRRPMVRHGTEWDWSGLELPRPNGGRITPRPEPPRPTTVWRTQLVDVPRAKRLLGIGARAELANGLGLESRADAVYVELRLFAEGQRGSWETPLLDGGAPFAVAIDDLQKSIEEIVVPDRLPVLANALRSDGVDLLARDLEILPFMLEISPELERALVERRLNALMV